MAPDEGATENVPESGSAAETATVAPLDALKASEEANPDATFVEHLEKLAHDGIAAVVSPAVESDVMAALVALVHDLVKGRA